MRIAPKLPNETARLAAVHRYGMLDTLPERAFDDITALVAQICGTPIALISLIDADRQWFKSRIGLDVAETGRDIAFCAHAINVPDQVLVVADMHKDDRFRDNPLVTSPPSIRFYAGAPIVTADGFALGTVCALDSQPRQLTEKQIGSLRMLSRLVGDLLEHAQLSRQQVAQAANNGRKQLENLLALTMDGLDLKAFIDRDFTYKYVNQTYLDYWNRRADQVEGKLVASVVSEEVFAEIQPLMVRALAGESVSYFARFDYPVKGRRHMQASYLPARDAAGAIIGLVIRVHDLQDMKDSEEKLRTTVSLLEEKNLVQQRFIHILSHDLREPVNTIVNFASLLATDYATALPDKARQYLRYVANGGERMKELLDDLLNYVHIDHAPPELRPIELDRVMIGVGEDLADSIARKMASVEWDALPVISGERSLIRILMQNLVANAIKFSRPSMAPEVRVFAADTGNFWELCVQDNGIGIPQAKLEKVFDLFQRLNARKEFDGTGLGLATCRKIVELHNGRIWATSELGKGSCFHVTLPKINMHPGQKTA